MSSPIAALNCRVLTYWSSRFSTSSFSFRSNFAASADVYFITSCLLFSCLMFLMIQQSCSGVHEPVVQLELTSFSIEVCNDSIQSRHNINPCHHCPSSDMEISQIGTIEWLFSQELQNPLFSHFSILIISCSLHFSNILSLKPPKVTQPAGEKRTFHA